MTHPSELERPKDSLAQIASELRNDNGDFSHPTLLADRIERLDAEMRKELEQLKNDYFGYVDSATIQVDNLTDENALLRAELDACHSLLNDPRVRALFPELKEGTVLASCSGGIG
jgi:hypothetical protein